MRIPHKSQCKCVCIFSLRCVQSGVFYYISTERHTQKPQIDFALKNIDADPLPTTPEQSNQMALINTSFHARVARTLSHKSALLLAN